MNYEKSLKYLKRKKKKPAKNNLKIIIFTRYWNVFIQVGWLVFWHVKSYWIIQAEIKQYWTSPGGNTPQGTNYMATCLPSRKLSKLDEPDMQDTAGDTRTSS